MPPTSNNPAGKLIITGASGQLGQRVAEHTLQCVPASQLVLVTRHPAQLAHFSTRGAEVRFGDFEQSASLVPAFAGASRLLLISAVDLERRAAQHRAAIAAAKHVGVDHVIYTSMLNPAARNPAAVAPSHLETEQALAASGLNWTLLRNSLYADYQAPEARAAIDSGTLRHNRGTGRIAYVARDDCALAAAAVLTSEGHINATYDITGPTLHSVAELAALYSKLGRRAVQSVALDDEVFIATLMGNANSEGHSRYGAELVASFGRSIRQGYMDCCTGHFAQLTGRPAKTLEEVLRATLDLAAS
jgi:NAD(P)H dehydrogenase (quinone)